MKKLAIGLAAGFGIAALGFTQWDGSFEGKIDSFSHFSYGGDDCHVVSTKIALKDNTGNTKAFDATEWSLRLCGKLPSPEMNTNDTYRVEYKEFLFNKLIHAYDPQAKQIALKPAVK
jgi:hypothetical protein